MHVYGCLLRGTPRVIAVLLVVMLLWGTAATAAQAPQVPEAANEEVLICPYTEEGQPDEAANCDYLSINADEFGEPDEAKEPNSWILKWRDGTSEARRQQLLQGGQISGSQPELGVQIIAPPAGVEASGWIQQLREQEEVEYVHANGRVHTMAAIQANDPGLSKQAHLAQIGAPKAWETARENTSITIAVVDTGVDLEHDDLADNLVEGTNLVNPGQLPDDDNGHGTGVAGVIAARGNNGLGVAGILWHAQIMPIKALDAAGYGDEDKLGEGIMYAIRNGAKIVVLSVGLYRQSPYMSDIAEYAESKGVLLVAASGNDGQLLGTKAAIKYPAAYPTVLAVGGATADGKPDGRANPGPEMDIVAPWRAYTTAIGGGYKYDEGTSMAAPQVAAAAALVWAVHPHLEPYQVRELLRQTAKDIGPAGWDPASGYGLLQIDAALTTPLKLDAGEPNETRDTARIFPINSGLSAALETGADRDWYAIEAPYDGTLSITFQGLGPAGAPQPPVRMINYVGDKAQGTLDVRLGNKLVEWPVNKGMNYIMLQLDDTSSKATLPYQLTSSFRIAADPYEPNGKAVEAFTLPPRSQVITGTFDTIGDRDWYAIQFVSGGTLKLKVETNTIRIDPALAYQSAGGSLKVIDNSADGEPEQSPEITITPGKFLIRIDNAVAREAMPAIGTYTLTIEFNTKYSDPNEPNNRSYEATLVRSGLDYVGVFHAKDDQDWFQLRLDKQSVVNLQVNDVPAARTVKLELYDRRQKLIATINGKAGQRLEDTRMLEEGNYYVRLTADQPFDEQYYIFKAKVDPYLSGFTDINSHWARAEIIALADKGIVSGYGDYKFEPDRGITRAEAVAILVRAIGTTASGRQAFSDVASTHWAYDPIAQAAAAGWVSGYPDGTFLPQRLVNRAEMATMLGKAMGIRAATGNTAPFADVEAAHWAAPMLASLKQGDWIKGYDGNLFKPLQSASRAEFVVLVYRALARKG